MWILISCSWPSILMSSSSLFSFDEIINKFRSAKYCSDSSTGLADSRVYSFVGGFATVFYYVSFFFEPSDEWSISASSSSSSSSFESLCNPSLDLLFYWDNLLSACSLILSNSIDFLDPLLSSTSLLLSNWFTFYLSTWFLWVPSSVIVNSSSYLD